MNVNTGVNNSVAGYLNTVNTANSKEIGHAKGGSPGHSMYPTSTKQSRCSYGSKRLVQKLSPMEISQVGQLSKKDSQVCF